MHQQWLQPPRAAFYDLQKILPGDGQGIATETAGKIGFETPLIEHRQPAKPPWIPITQLRFMGARKRHAYMNMLRKSGTGGGKEEQSRHAEFGHDVAGLTLPLETKSHALPEPVRRLQDRPCIPAPFGKAFTDDVRPADPGVRQHRSGQTSPDLSGNDLSFGKFGHGMIRPSWPAERQRVGSTTLGAASVAQLLNLLNRRLDIRQRTGCGPPSHDELKDVSICHVVHATQIGHHH